MLRVAGPLAVVAIIAAVQPSGALAQEVGRLELEHDVAARTMNWSDIDGESAYRVSGNIGYHHFAACGTREQAFSEHVVVDQSLPPNTTRFDFPLPQDQRADSIAGIELRVEALDAHSNVIAMNGFAMTADKICTPEEIAAAGSGLQQTDSSRLLPVIAGLLVVGAVSFCGGLITLRKRA